MITPLDIQTKTFKKAINGYDKNDVDSYLDLILADYEKLYTSSIESTDKINTLSKLVDSYKAMEDNMKNSIMVAQQAAEDVTKNAREKAEITVSEANLKAQAIIAEAEGKIKDLSGELAQLRTAMELYKSQAVGMLNAQIEVVNKFKTE